MHDSTGNLLVDIRNGYVTGCAAGPVTRAILDRAPVPGLAGGPEAPVFGFAEETIPGHGSYYSMGLSEPRFLAEGDNVGSACRLVMTGTGSFSSTAIYPDFPNRSAAEAWMATPQYGQVKALLTSLRYS